MNHPDAESSLCTWYKLVSLATWDNFVQLRDLFPAADLVGNFTVFNIGGNKYRLIALVDYNYQKVFIRYVLTHAEYDEGGWKMTTDINFDITDRVSSVMDKAMR